MRNTGFLLTIIMVVGMAAQTGCTPDDTQYNSSLADTTATHEELLESMTGTAWTVHRDYWIQYFGYNIHVLQDEDLLFVSDSIGSRHTYGEGAENFPAGDFTCEFVYTYDSESCIGTVDEGASGDKYDFLYDTLTGNLVIPASPTASSHEIYTRVN